jgi:acyl-CoA synthetase (AMP-forming)/AMP-acid ligase II
VPTIREVLLARALGDRPEVRAALLAGDAHWTWPDRPAGFEEFPSGRPDLGPKQWPRHVRLFDALPRTAAKKVLERELRGQSLDHGTHWVRAGRGTSYS